ncbi:hypothetical protein CAPTEDRAFT_32393, partial [Capitella teleta]
FFSAGDVCCRPSGSSQCTAVCRAIFIQNSLPTSSQSRMIESVCEQSVAQCVHNYTELNPPTSLREGLLCCDHSDNLTCQRKCRRALEVHTREEDIVDMISEHCGLPNAMEPLWQCFLRSSTNTIRRHEYTYGGRIEMTGVDGAKLQCCAKAVTPGCRQLCVKVSGTLLFTQDYNGSIQTYSRWTTSVRFHDECTYHPRERDLNRCLEEVAEPCELGCSNLSFCSNFNYRPTEMFRRCDPEADDMAKKTAQIWSQGAISLPLILPYDIPVRDIRTCHPEVWKAIACTLQIKPCHQAVRATWICRSDCLSILGDCLDYARLPFGLTAADICQRLSPHDSTLPCISLSKYLIPSEHISVHHEVTQPCSSNPCSASQICMVSRRKCRNPGKCPLYTCKSGCAMGEVLSHLVPHKSYVRLPKATDRQLQCHRVCKCGHHNMLHKCSEMECQEERACVVSYNRIHSHGSKFLVGCNKCSCYEGEVTCTQRHCPYHASTEIYTGLPCNCDRQYAPVCAHNGRTYPNACVAKCLGLTDLQIASGQCYDQHPCQPNPCEPLQKCLPKRRICLDITSEDCSQYECAHLDNGCRKQKHSTVCNGTHDFPSACVLMQHRQKLAYREHCMSGCQSSGVVCGINGETYSSECAAWADGVLLDYLGKCSAAGHLTNAFSQNWSCSNVICPNNSLSIICKPFVPPGACCPICAGEIRVLYSQTAIQKAAQLTSSPVSIADIRRILHHHIMVLECDLFAYLGIEGDLIIHVVPVVRSATPLQLEACRKESEKIGSLIISSSPTLTSHVVLATFIAAEMHL